MTGLSSSCGSVCISCLTCIKPQKCICEDSVICSKYHLFIGSQLHRAYTPLSYLSLCPSAVTGLETHQPLNTWLSRQGQGNARCYSRGQLLNHPKVCTFVFTVPWLFSRVLQCGNYLSSFPSPNPNINSLCQSFKSDLKPFILFGLSRCISECVNAHALGTQKSV